MRTMHELEDLQYEAAITYLQRRHEAIVMDWKSVKFYRKWVQHVHSSRL